MMPKQDVARAASAAIAKRNMKRWKKERKMWSGVRMMRSPEATIPVTWIAKMAVKTVSMPPVAEASLFGMLRAEKSITVVPTWRVEFVVGMSEPASSKVQNQYVAG